MTSNLNPVELFAWCRIPTGQLEGHPQARVPIKVLPKPHESGHVQGLVVYFCAQG